MKIITCFSYKGGAARTTAAANISAALASMRPGVGSIKTPLRRKVGLIDLDVFSAGTHSVFEIGDRDIQKFSPSIQDYLRVQPPPSEYAVAGGVPLDHPFMNNFRMLRGAEGNCHEGFTLFPAKPRPDERFVVQKQHENVLWELMERLESEQGFDYVVLDGESGIRQMAEIAIRLADIVLVFFRPTWQHIIGTLNTCEEDFLVQSLKKPFYLIPTCVPTAEESDGVFLESAAGLMELRAFTQQVPEDSKLNEFAAQYPDGPGYFWSGAHSGGERVCIHDSLYLRGAERVIVFEGTSPRDRAAADFYTIAAEIDRLHPPA